jgi:hypothetical protein
LTHFDAHRERSHFGRDLRDRTGLAALDELSASFDGQWGIAVFFAWTPFLAGAMI